MNKFLIFIVFYLCFGISLAQTSYEFKQALPPESPVVNTVESDVFGSYKNEKTGTEIVLNEEGIFFVTIVNSFITKEQVRESAKFTYRNGYLFGIKENDSIPCILEDEKYFFGIKTKTKVSGEENKAILKKVSANKYILNYFENYGYSPSIFEIVGNTLILKHFTYPTNTEEFKDIKRSEKKKTPAFELLILDPNKKEWEKLDKAIIFDAEIVFKKL